MVRGVKMTVERMIELFEQRMENTNMGTFDEMEHPLKMEFKRRDLCAFVKLNELVEGNCDIISAAEHDQIWLGVELEDLAKVITEKDIIFLVDCGVFISDESLSMFA